MWFKQIKLFKLTNLLQSADHLTKKLEELSFKPCRATMPISVGWVPPVNEENMPIVQMINGYLIFCLQIEEKILPSGVIREELIKKIKDIEKNENRKVNQTEKYSLKDEIILTLLPRAFSKISRIYAYIDTKNKWLIVGTNNEKKATQLISLFKKSIESEILPFEIKDLSTIMTRWLIRKDYPPIFSIEKSCQLQDPNNKNRVIRCQEQDLFVNSIQSLIKEGCQIKQLALCWQDRLSLYLSDNFSFSRMKFHDEIIVQSKEMEAETIQQKFHADFFIMSQTITQFLKDLLNILEPAKVEVKHVNLQKTISTTLS